jgi:hypothetical protein
MYVFPSDKTVKYESDCALWKHLQYDLSCPAFPQGVPESILEGKIKHQEVIKEQVGTIVYEKLSRLSL